METINQFQYTYANLAIYQFDSHWILAGISIVVGIAIMYLLYKIIYIVSLYSISYHTDKALAQKKKILGDLILMKDIQTELEKEIEQAILKAAFHS